MDGRQYNADRRQARLATMGQEQSERSGHTRHRVTDVAQIVGDVGGNIPAGPQLVVISGAKVITRPITSQKQLLQDLQAAKEGRL